MVAEVINYPSVSVSGVLNIGRARAIWHDGTLKVFDLSGVALSFLAEKPTRKTGYLRAWDVKTQNGDMILRGKCLTCGGKKWWRLMRIPSSELWGQSA